MFARRSLPHALSRPVRKARRIHLGVAVALGASLLAGLGGLGLRNARAGDAAFSATDTTAPNIVGDSNVSAQPQQGPDAFTIAVEFCNTGVTTPMDNVVAYIGDGTTPGEFPDTVVPPGGAYSGTFDLDMVTGLGNDAVRMIGTLAPGECRVEFWIVAYDVVDAAGDPVWGRSNDPLDDLTLGFVFWAEGTDRDAGLPVAVTGSDSVTVRNEISAATNKIAPNGAFTTVTPGATVPIGTPVQVTFNGVKFGTPNQGFDADGDGLPDVDLWIQPIGEAALWNPDYFRLTAVDATLEGTRCGGGRPDVTLTLSDTFYQSGLDAYGSCQWGGSYTYTLVALSPGSSAITPYQEVASGSDNEKYNGDYCGTDPASSPDICVLLTAVGTLSLDKQVDLAEAVPGDTLTYSIAVTNTGTQPTGDPATGAHLVVTDAVPAGTSFAAGSATCDAACSIGYSDDGGASFLPSEPADPAAVTHLQFSTGAAIAPLSSAGFGFEVVVDAAAAGAIVNEAGLAVANGPEFLWDTATTVVPMAAVAKTPSVGSVPEPGGTVTFSVDVTNRTSEAITMTSLIDDVFGDLFDGGNPLVFSNTCDDIARVIPGSGSASCSFDAAVGGDAAGPDHIDTVTVTVTDGGGNASSASDDAVVAYDDVLPSITVTKAPSTNSVPEPGATVTFTVTVGNTSIEAVTLTSLVDDVFGDLLDGANPAVSTNTCDDQPTSIAVGGTLTCSFDGFVAGHASDPAHVDVIDASATDNEGNPATGSDSASVSFTDVPPTISVGKTPVPGSVVETGGMVTFDVRVTNTSFEAVTLTSLVDDVFGDLLDGANPAVSNNTCDDQPTALGIGAVITCSFDAYLRGDAGGPNHVDTVTGVVLDDDGTTGTGSDTASVVFVDGLPGLSVVKSPSVGSVPEPGGTVTFAVQISNSGGEDATLTSLVDDVFGDLLDGANPAVSNNTCDDQPTALGIGAVVTCSFDAAVAGLAGDPPHVDTITAVISDDEGNTVSGADSASVSFSDVLPTITTTKTPSVGSIPEPGGTVTFTVEVANTSVEPLILASLVDDVFGDLLDGANPAVSSNTCDDQATGIGVGGTFTCSFDAALSGLAGDPDHVNTVTAVASDGEGNSATDAGSANVAFGDSLPTISVLKDPSTGSVPETGGTVTFTVEVANTSVEPVTLTSLVDDVFGDLLDGANPAVSSNTCDDQATGIGVGGTFACSFDAVLSGDASGADHTNTVSAVASDGGGNDANGSDGATVSFDDALPSISASKSPSAGSLAEPGGTVTFGIVVTNDGDEDVTLTSLTDDVFGDLLDGANPAVSNNTCDDQPTSIAVGGTFTCSFDGFVGGLAGDPPHVDTVTAIAIDNEANPVTESASATVPFADVPPTIDVTKTPGAGSVPEPGGTVTFTVEVANTSVEPVTLASLVDDLFGDLLDGANPAVSNNTCDDQPTLVAVGGTFTCSFDAALSGLAGDPDHVNTVTAVASDGEGNTATGSDAAAVAFGDSLPSIGVAKTASAGSIPEPGGTVTFTVEVANTSVEPVTLTTLTDDVFGDLLDGANPAVSNNTCDDQPTGIGVGGTFTCSFDAALAGSPAGPAHTNTVTAAAGDGEGNVVFASDGETVSFTDVLPTLTVSKTPSAGSAPESGGTITFTVVVTNTSVEPITQIGLADDVFGDLLDGANPAVSNNTCDDQPTGIPVAATFTCSFDATVTGDASGPSHVNTISATAQDDEGNLVNGTASATVVLTDDIPTVSVSKTPSAPAVVEPGGPVTFTIEVVNNGNEAVTLSTLTDDVFGDLLDGANPAVSNNTCDDQATAIGVGGTLTCSFDATLAGAAGGPDHSNTVTATATDNEGNAAVASGSATVGFIDALPTISVTKTPSVGSLPEPGGTVTFTVVVTNTSGEPVTLITLIDSEFGDLLDGANPAISSNTCDDQPTAMAIGGTFTCTFDVVITGNASGPDHADTVTAIAEDVGGNLALDTDGASVTFTDVPPTIDVTKTPGAGSVPEPGGTVTFTVEVANTSVEPVTLAWLVDDVFGDLLDGANPAVSNNTCDDQPTLVAVGVTFTCSFDAALSGLAGDPDHVNTVTAAAFDDEGNGTTDGDDAVVAFGDGLPSVSVTKTPGAGSVPEPGGTVTFTVEVVNTSVEPLILASLVDDVFGDLLDGANPAVSSNTCDDQATGIGIGVTFTCSFDAALSGLAGDPDHVNTVTAAAGDGEGNTATDDDDAIVGFADVLPSVSVTKTPSAGSVPEPGGTVTFTVEVANTSVEPVTLTTLTDDVFGDLLDGANPAVSNNTCDDQPTAIGIGGTFTCTFDADLVGNDGDPDHVDVVTATVNDGDGNVSQDSDDATVGFTPAFGGLSGHLFVDEDGNGVQDPGEPDLPGVDVVIVDSDGTEYRVTSDSGGNWAQTVALGAATLAVDPATVPAGYNLTTGNDTQAVAVPAGGAASEPIGYQPEPASVSGTVWVDLDGDRSRTVPEPPLAGVLVRLLDAGGNPVTTTTTAADGSYSFGGLVPGDYSIEIDQSTVPEGYALVRDPDGDTDGSTAVSLAPGEDLTGMDFIEEGTGSIGDLIWLDADGDGVQDLDEEPLANISVGLTYAGPDGAFGTDDDWVYPEQVTGGDGLYRYYGLPPGIYRVSVDLDSVGGDMSPTTTPSIVIPLGPGEDFDDGDVGFAPGEDPLPQTGIDADRLGLAALVFILIGLALLLVGRGLDHQRRRVSSVRRLPS